MTRDITRELNRRNFLRTTVALASLTLASNSMVAYGQENIDKDSDEYWKTIMDQYKVTDEFINLNAGHWGIMSEPVREAFANHTKFINAYNSHYMGSGRRADPNARSFYVDRGKILDRLAKKLGVRSDELVFTRNVTESLQLLISGYNRIKPGDTVLYADAAYYSMQAEMRHLKVHRKANVIKLKIPDPATYENQIAVFEQGIKDNPGTKLLLVTHMANHTGVIIPLKEITAMARSYGVDVIVDAAHSWGQYDFDFADMDVDFVGFNLHKWIGAPLGVGLMYIRKGRMLDIDTKSSKGPVGNDDINNRVQTGTMNMAAILSVNDALDFLDDIGIVHIDRRFKALRHQWVNEFLDDDRIDILSPQDDRMHAGLTSFRIKAHPSAVELGNTLLGDYGINSAPIGNINGIRISPGLYNSKADMDALAAAIKDIMNKM